MSVCEFIAKPCQWSERAPAMLRQSMYPATVTWESYSTSEYIDGTTPTVIGVLDSSSPSNGPGISVEMLPDHLTPNWRELGLRFASKPEIREYLFLDLLASSLALIYGVSAARGTVRGMCRSLHVLLAAGSDYDVSFSDPTLPFSIFVSCPPIGADYRIERLAECIFHEALHLQLSLIDAIEPLVYESSSEIKVFSPWKGEHRTLLGMIHALYVFGNLQRFWNILSVTTPQSRYFAQGRAQCIQPEIGHAADLLNDQPLTPIAHRILSVFSISSTLS